MSGLTAVFSLSMLAQTLAASVPYVCAAQGGVLSERSGVVNIGLEGMLLGSALGAVAAANATGSAWVGALAGIGTGAAIGIVHALVVVKGRVDAIISGIAINLGTLGGSRVALRALYGSSSNSPAIEGFRFGGEGASGASMLLRSLASPTFVATVVATVAVIVMLSRTRFGL